MGYSSVGLQGICPEVTYPENLETLNDLHGTLIATEEGNLHLKERQNLGDIGIKI